jgi:hypothetical protein
MNKNPGKWRAGLCLPVYIPGIKKEPLVSSVFINKMAGAGGLEPTDAGVKVPCLTNLATPQRQNIVYQSFKQMSTPDSRLITPQNIKIANYE